MLNQVVTRNVSQVHECEFENKNKALKFSRGRKVLFHKCETRSFSRARNRVTSVQDSDMLHNRLKQFNQNATTF